MSDRRWHLLVQARPEIVRRLTDLGVVRAEYVSAFPEDDFAIWIATESDADLAALQQVDDLHDRVARVLRDIGFVDAELRGLLVCTQSQETVDRDYAGSWFYAPLSVSLS
ncbi:hypothetical protein [Kineosporia sp. A_224]|uniref:hypothetical protein n=1 Tax=Kineosporia sp. A_224 TaxID=1962180 RepID=UPI00117A45CC|nr:hypothetical protein [Kineosporia sp. A_224]